MIIAAYQSEADYQAASEEEVASILGKLSRLLTSTPHGHQGTGVISYGDAPRAEQAQTAFRPAHITAHMRPCGCL